MKFRKVVAGAIMVQGLTLLGWTTANADQILTYTGNPFTTVNSPYTTSDEVFATIDLSMPLGNSVTVSVSPKSFTLTDGQQTITQANTVSEIFVFNTGPSGQITLWNVVVASTSGEINSQNSPPTIPTDIGFGPLTNSTVNGSCPNASLSLTGSGGGNACEPGVWTSTLTSAPEPSTAAVLGSGLLGLGLFWWSRRRKLDLAQ